MTCMPEKSRLFRNLCHNSRMRYLEKFIIQDLKKKMVFIAGPRQCGKTTLAQFLLKKEFHNQGIYLNWDYEEDKKNILEMKWAKSDQLLIFDEIHKFARWKNWIKGIFDKLKNNHKILVTGSARLDVYKKGGDSLLGRYHFWRLHPFDLAENPLKNKTETLKRLLKFGGFPEPFLEADEREAKRWRKERFDKIVREDLRDLEKINDIQALMLFATLLKSRVGGEIVFSNISRDVLANEKTLARWLPMLEKMYLLFVIRPYSSNIARAVQKTPKVYFYDNADVDGDEGAVFENLVATHLLKRIHFLEDYTGDHYQLCYIRDKDKREVDFVITKNNKVLALYEVKLSAEKISQSLRYYSNQLKPKYTVQIVLNCKRAYHTEDILVTDPITYFTKTFVPWDM